MATITKRVVTVADTTPVGVLSIHKMTEWLNTAVILYNDARPHSVNISDTKMESIEFHNPIFLDDILRFDCESIYKDNHYSIIVKVLRNNLPVIASTYTRCH